MLVSVCVYLLASDYVYILMCFFFFKQKTAYEMRISDWSSDVCSSDLARWFHICIFRMRGRLPDQPFSCEAGEGLSCRPPTRAFPLLPALKHQQRIHANVEPTHPPVQMRPGPQTGRARCADHPALTHPVTRLYAHPPHVPAPRAPHF